MTLSTAAALTDAQLAQWEADGYIDPMSVLPQNEVAGVAHAFEREFDDGSTMNRHCDLSVVGAICRQADVWRRLETLLGPDLVLWRTNLFLGNPAIQWHEDQHARLLGNGFGLSALIALTDGSADNCTLVAPGSHKLDPADKARRYNLVEVPRAGGNVRYDGQLAETDFIRMPMRAGQCLIFHPALLHASSGSLGTTAAMRRTNLVLRVTPGTTRVHEDAYAPTGLAGPVVMRGSGSGNERYVSLA